MAYIVEQDIELRISNNDAEYISGIKQYTVRTLLVQVDFIHILRGHLSDTTVPVIQWEISQGCIFVHQRW